ncbi:MAG: redoxin domain-containing protein [Pseudomonadales bacterium]
MQLQEHVESYRAAGLGVVVLTYDAPEAQQSFVDKFAIDYPMLSDVDAATVKALGILNSDYAPDHAAYGIPYPGAFVLDADLLIREKVFVEGYQTRVDAESVLGVARRALNLQP